MRRLVKRRFLAHLTATSLVLATGTAGAATQQVPLRELPTQVISDLIDDAEQTDPSDPHRAAVLGEIAKDPRYTVRAEVAEALSLLWPDREATLALLRTLANDRSADVRAATSLGLARTLERARPLERIELVSELALSPHSRERLAVARALSRSVPVLVRPSVVEHLSNDPNPRTRAALTNVMAAHFREDPVRYQRVAERLLRDSDRGVRARAQSLLTRMRHLSGWAEG
jgi:HEAT repeat protein